LSKTALTVQNVFVFVVMHRSNLVLIPEKYHCQQTLAANSHRTCFVNIAESLWNKKQAPQ